MSYGDSVHRMNAFGWRRLSDSSLEGFKHNARHSQPRADKARGQLLFGNARVSEAAIQERVAKLRKSDQDMEAHFGSIPETESISPSLEADKFDALNDLGTAHHRDKVPEWAENVRWEDCPPLSDQQALSRNSSIGASSYSERPVFSRNSSVSVSSHQVFDDDEVMPVSLGLKLADEHVKKPAQDVLH